MSFDIFDFVTDVLSINISAISDLALYKTSSESSSGNINISRAVAPDGRRVLQGIWDLRLGREEFFSSPLFPVILSITFYFSLCTPFMICDLYGKNWNWIQKYKIQPDFNVTTAHCFDALSVTFWNHVLFILPAACAQWVWTPPTPMPELAPTLLEFFWHQFAGLLIFDFQYFVWHWTHHKIRFLYKHVHAIHHRYHAPFSWVTQYLHPWELITVGFLTTTNTWFFDCHPLTTWSYMMVSIIASVEAHIGFDFPFALNYITFGFFGGAPKHDMHHYKPMTNFEPFFNHFDRLFDTFCPVMRAGGIKPKELLDYERKQKEIKKLR
jgi:cholesterol 25-hydroxylase